MNWNCPLKIWNVRLAQIYEIQMGKCVISNFSSYIVHWALILFSSLLTLDFFPMTYSKTLIFLKLDRMPLHEDKLILQAATVDEQCVLFKRVNRNPIIYTATWICIWSKRHSMLWIQNTQISALCIYLGSHNSLIYIHTPRLNNCRQVLLCVRCSAWKEFGD